MGASASGITALVGEPLSGVGFVQDYVEFYFDGKILRAIAPPTLLASGRSFTFPDKGSRDAMCERIGRRVEELLLKDEEAIVLLLEGGDRLSVPLSGPHATPEAAHYVPGWGQPIEVW